MADAHANFAYSTVATAPSPASSGTSLVVASGDGAKFPAAPFNATVWPAGVQPLTTNAEIVRVTAKSTDTFTITRTQEGSSARSIGAGDQIAATITAKTLTDAEGPGTELGYSEITSGVNITSTTEATPTTIITASAITFDGGAVIAHFFAPFVLLDTGAANDQMQISLFEGTTQIGRLAQIRSLSATFAFLGPVKLEYRFTPSAGSHTYKVCAYVGSTTGTPQVGAGAGGTGLALPAFLRFTKV